MARLLFWLHHQPQFTRMIEHGFANAGDSIDDAFFTIAPSRFTTSDNELRRVCCGEPHVFLHGGA